jgi:phosphomannomutase
LKNLGADTAHSIHLNPNGTFPSDTGVPNPEYKPMMDATIKVCRECHADLGIMLDTDADRSGFIVPRTINSDGTKRDYEPLNRNRLIALLSVSFASSSPGCTIVTDSVTSEGLSHFLERTLQLHHVRYLKGYANVIGKARELTESGRALAEMAIETSGHCAMRENGYLDDGTYTAVKVISLLAQVKNDENGSSGSLLDLISELQEMEEVNEFRMNVLDGSIVSTGGLFEQLCQLVENACEVNEDWVLDVENLEGVRVRNLMDGGFFMVRKSLHDPLISVQVEGSSVDSVRKVVIGPLVRLMEEGLGDSLSILDLKPLLEY